MWVKIIGVILAIAVILFVLRYLWFLVPVGMLIYYFAKGKQKYSKGKVIGASALCVFSLLYFVGTSNSPTTGSVPAVDAPVETSTTSVTEQTPAPSVPEPPDPVSQLREQAAALTLASTREEYEVVQTAYDALSYSQKKDLSDVSDRLKEISSAIKQREQEQEDKEVAAEFENLIVGLPDTAAEAREGFSEAAAMYRKLTNAQKDLLSEETKTKYDNMNTQIREIEHREHLENSTVVISATGSKYHYKSCRTLKYARTETTAAAAQAAGYGPCGVCNPPS